MLDSPTLSEAERIGGLEACRHLVGFVHEVGGEDAVVCAVVGRVEGRGTAVGHAQNAVAEVDADVERAFVGQEVLSLIHY